MSQRPVRSRSAAPNSANRSGNSGGGATNQRPPAANSRSQSANPRPDSAKGNDRPRQANRGNTGNPRSRMPFYMKGPGPAGYTLPPLLGKPHHALTHKIMPASGLGFRSTREPARYGPGPAHYAIKYGLKTNGFHDRGLVYTMRPMTAIRIPYKSPGPAIVDLSGKIDLLRPKNPTYTLRIRPPSFNKTNYPAPNAYLLGPMIGPAVITRPSQALCTMKGNRLQRLYVRSPGPVYDIGKVELVKHQAPVYSLRPKLGYAFKDFGPGAAAYILNKVIYPKRPAWMFGIKHTDFAGILKNKCDRLLMESPSQDEDLCYCCY